MIITSPVNPNLKFARRVREGKEPESIFVEGYRLCSECLDSGLAIHSAFHTPEPGTQGKWLIEELERRGCPVYETSAEAFEVVSDTVNPQGIIVIASRPLAKLETVFSRPDGLIVALDAVQDPGNAGTIVRTAEASGVAGIVALKGTVDLFAPKTLRSAMGSSFRIPIATEVSPDDLVKWCRERSFALVGTTSHNASPYTQFDWTRPAVLVLGNEAGGIRESLLEASTANVTIPLHPPVESINVSAAAAALLFEAARQRKEKLST